jgi:hypothetical protein
VTVDPGKWADALKSAITTAGVYKLALAAVCALYWLGASRQIIPSAETWEIRASAFGFLLFGFLWLANVVAALLQFFPPAPWMAHWIAIRREQAHLRGYIPSMTDKEREIIGYLLAKNQKLFIAAQDGGYAMPLISQRIVKIALQPGQTYSFEHTPMVIPDHLWEVLVAHRDRFPYSSLGGNHEPDPWRIPWMMRR